MGKAIASALVGYVVIFVVMFALMSASWLAVGSEGAFQPRVWDVTRLWLGLLLAAGLIAAIAGGYVTSLISSDTSAPKMLMGIVLVFGILFALPALVGSGNTPAGPRPADLAMFEAMANGRQPTWVTLLNPVLGILGVWVGTRLRRASRPD